MGGSPNRSPGLSDKERKAIEKMVKRRLETASTRRNVFLSFAHEDIGDITMLRGQARNADSEIEFNDWSVREPIDSDKASYIKAGICDRIDRCSVTLVYVSEQTVNSKWVNWEIDESLRRGKAVIAIHKGDKPPSKLPASLQNNGIKPIRWTWEGVKKAIDDA